jgi:hypothetical protein
MVHHDAIDDPVFDILSHQPSGDVSAASHVTIEQLTLLQQPSGRT